MLVVILVDGRGSIYVNSIEFDFLGGGQPTGGVIALITPVGAVRQVAGDLAFPNGMVAPGPTCRPRWHHYGRRRGDLVLVGRHGQGLRTDPRGRRDHEPHRAGSGLLRVHAGRPRPPHVVHAGERAACARSRSTFRVSGGRDGAVRRVEARQVGQRLPVTASRSGSDGRIETPAAAMPCRTSVDAVVVR